MSKDKIEVNMNVYDIPILVEALEEANKEIERLKNINEEHRILNGELRKELQEKESIIKEVREYITYWHYRNDFRINSFTTNVKKELLEILKGE